MDELLKEYDVKTLDCVMSEIARKVFREIYYELDNLQNMVDDGGYSLRELSYKIHEIKNKIY